MSLNFANYNDCMGSERLIRAPCWYDDRDNCMSLNLPEYGYIRGLVSIRFPPAGVSLEYRLLVCSTSTLTGINVQLIWYACSNYFQNIKGK